MARSIKEITESLIALEEGLKWYIEAKKDGFGLGDLISAIPLLTTVKDGITGLDQAWEEIKDLDQNEVMTLWPRVIRIGGLMRQAFLTAHVKIPTLNVQTTA